ncbi:MAG: glycosyltransferase family 2 protein, partial [Dactylosporangium sp.]|nr:glycosyltransferase family 2 protein [Dactylosporangium sp.]
HYLARVLADLRAQTYPNLEVVLGLHGVELDARQHDLVRESGLPVTTVAIPSEVTLGEALAAVTRRASGSLVTKVDDDDRYGPEHIWDLVLARYYSGATVAGRAAEFVYLTSYDTTIRRRVADETYTDVVAGGTILIDRGDLEHVGGWRPVPRSVDRALLDRVRAAGGLVYRTHPFGFIYTRHSDGHTWDPGERYFLRDPVRQWPGLPAWSGFTPAGERDLGEGGTR